jgi:glycosyltransferase involved in cell wall biosynthesis
MNSYDAKAVSVVLATFEAPKVLETTLRAFSEQRDADFEIVVADDGSGESIAQVVERWRATLDLQHVWQPDEGFRKARALDLAVLAAKGDYLAFLDADCVPRRGFVQALRRGALPGWFLSTKRIELSQKLSRRIVENRLAAWRWSAAEWLIRAPREVRRPGYLVQARDRRRPWRTRQPEFTPPWSAYCLIGLHREDFEAVNGYDTRCRRSDDGEDQDLAIRLRRSGLKCGWSGPASTVLHLWHEHRADRVGDHLPLFHETEAGTHVEAVVGLRELSAELGAHVTA